MKNIKKTWDRKKKINFFSFPENKQKRKKDKLRKKEEMKINYLYNMGITYFT